MKALPSTTKLPPVTLIDTAASIPLTVIAALETSAPGSIPVCSVKLNASGVVSAALTVMVTVAVVLKLPSLTVDSNVKASASRRAGAVKVGAATLVELSVTVVPLLV